MILELSSCVTEVGAVSHPCEDQLVCRCTYEGGRVPYFNAGIYLENKQLVGKVDEILGPITDFVSFTNSCGALHTFYRKNYFF